MQQARELLQAGHTGVADALFRAAVSVTPGMVKQWIEVREWGAALLAQLRQWTGARRTHLSVCT